MTPQEQVELQQSLDNQRKAYASLVELYVSLHLKNRKEITEKYERQQLFNRQDVVDDDDDEDTDGEYQEDSEDSDDGN
eukprot:UN03604